MQIVVRQISGLGNQLFQYAAGRYYAKRYHAPFRMATDLIQNQHSHGYPRPFLLSHFSIPVSMQPLSTFDRTLFSPKPYLKPGIAVLKRALGVQLFTEPIGRRYTFLEDLPIERSVRTLYLFGYWQAWQLVEHVATELRQDLRFRCEATGRNLELLEQIAQTPNAVSLHVRRGDYTLAVEGNISLPLSYYEDAIRYFQERLQDPKFFVFSDDIAYTRAHLPSGLRAVFVDHNDDASSHEDLRLMSACDHHIIANSSFSWWGAWLNPLPTKMVYAPKFWLLKADTYFPDLLPPDWTLGTFELKRG